MNEASLIATAEAARARLLADLVAIIAIRATPAEARERSAWLVRHFLAVLRGPRGNILTPEARAEFEALCAGLPNDIDCYHGAELMLTIALGPQKDALRLRLTTSNRTWDKQLTPWTKILFGDGPFKAAVDAITPGTGHRDDAEDVERHVDLLLNKPLPPGTSLPWTPQQLKDAAADASAYLRLLAEGSPAEQEALLLMRKAYARAATNFRRIQALGLALAFDMPEATEWFLSFNTDVPA